MRKSSIFSAGAQRLSLLLPAMLAFSCSVHAQANFWSVFGSYGCGSLGDNNYSMPCTVAPSSLSFTSIPVLNDLTFLPGTGNSVYFQNSVYDATGHLLFSVNANGIYAPDASGTNVFGFANAALPYAFDGFTIAGGSTLQATSAVSDISIFPAPGDCTGDKYYVVFWCGTDVPTSTEGYGSVLRCIEVDILPASFGTSAAPATWYNIIDNTINPDSKIYGSTNAAGFQIAADALNTDGSRDVYTVTPDVNVASGPAIYYSTVTKWEFPATGGLPSASDLLMGYTYGHDYMAPSFTSKAEILTMPALLGTGMDKYLCFAGHNGGANDYVLQTYDISAGVISSFYTAPTTTATPPGAISGTTHFGYQEITGFEYLPAPINEMYFIYTDYSFADPVTFASILTSGLCYAPPPAVYSSSLSSPTNYTMSLAASTQDYVLSDLERNKNGDLYLVKTNYPTTNPMLAYLPTGAGGSISSTSALNSATPTAVPVSCTSYPNVSVTNYQPLVDGSPIVPWYLGSQIRGEDYSTWGAPQLDYVIPSGATVTWTAASNPVQPGASVINVHRIIIQPGAKLTISGLTVQFPVDGYVYVSAGGLLAGNGGKLYLTGCTLTHAASGCSGSSAMWGGVQVAGSRFDQQAAPSSYQGYLNMSAATISYANTGVWVGEAGLPYMTSPTVTVYPTYGGGIIQAYNSNFTNDACGANFSPYDYFLSGVEFNNLSYFNKCSFTATDPDIIPPGGSLYGIQGSDIMGLNINGCAFANNTGTTSQSFGIYAVNMGINVNGYSFTTLTGTTYLQSTFTNYTDGIYNSSATQTHTASILNSVFTGNTVGAYLDGSINPTIAYNTFNVPVLFFSPTMYPPSYYSLQSIGLMLHGAELYVVINNTFKKSGGAPFSPPGINGTVGALAWNTQIGLDENLVANNSFSYLSTANLSNYKNRDGNNHGLWYKCNTYRNNLVDEATQGSNNSTSFGDGIRNYQGVEPYTPYMFYTPYGPGLSYASTSYGYPAGNTFSTGSGYNLDCDPVGTASFTYYYCGLTGASACDPLEIPGITGTTGVDYGMAATSLSIEDDCTIPFSVGGTGGSLPDVGSTPVPLVKSPTSPTDNYYVGLNNIHYYMTDSRGLTHRDSLYYWLGMINTSSSKLVTAQMLVQDGYADSAAALYKSITVTDTMDSVNKAEFTTWGGMAVNVQSQVMAHNASINAAIQYANANGLDVDSLAIADSSLFSQPALDSTSEASLITVFSNSRHWGRILAENILQRYDPATFNAMIAQMPDTLLYPALPDSFQAPKYPTGVLAVTEISQGPSVENGGCEYAEMIVGNCGSDDAPYVDVSGWIIDDNSGAFDTAGCSQTGITRGHYRLAPGNPIWQNIAVGSVIVVYNADVNCYNLPAAFTIDSVHHIFWIPVSATQPQNSYVLERYDGSENQNPGSYCSDTGTTVYTPAYGWEQTIALAPQDAIQVRCPGCNVTNPNSPAFYQGIGYAPGDTYCFQAIPAGTNSLGGPVLYDANANQKFVFKGHTAADFSDNTKWGAYNADAAGTPPRSLGYVDKWLSDAAINHTLGLPCCGSRNNNGNRTSSPARPTVPGDNAAQNIMVYPNPATMTVYFQFPASANVTIKLMDVTGQLMDQQVIQNNTTASFNVKSYAPGIYLYQVITQDQTQTGKILVE